MHFFGRRMWTHRKIGSLRALLWEEEGPSWQAWGGTSLPKIGVSSIGVPYWDPYYEGVLLFGNQNSGSHIFVNYQVAPKSHIPSSEDESWCCRAEHGQLGPIGNARDARAVIPGLSWYA